MNTKKILLFLLFAFGISWISAGAVYFAGIEYGSTISVIVTATFYMMSPAIAAIIVQKGIYKEPIKAMGLDFKQIKWKQMLWAPVIMMLFCAFTIGCIVLFGNVLQIKEFGFFSLDPGLLNDHLREMITAKGGMSMPDIPVSPLALFIIALVFSALFGGFINGIFTFGEELGWRGFMYNETKQLGFWKSGLLSGTIWGLWHAPLILQGHNYPGHPVAGVFMMVLFCISLAFLMNWMRAKTKSVLAPTLFHGMINAGAGGVMLFCYDYNDLLGNIAGVAGALGGFIVMTVILIVDRKIIRSQE